LIVHALKTLGKDHIGRNIIKIILWKIPRPSPVGFMKSFAKFVKANCKITEFFTITSLLAILPLYLLTPSL